MTGVVPCEVFCCTEPLIACISLWSRNILFRHCTLGNEIYVYAFEQWVEDIHVAFSLALFGRIISNSNIVHKVRLAWTFRNFNLKSHQRVVG